MGIAREWLDVKKVEVIAHLDQSALALALQDFNRQKSAILLLTSAATSDLLGKACSPYSVQWITDTRSTARALALATLKEGGKAWFFMTVDYAFGKSLERDVIATLKENGGQVLGSVHYPIETVDFSSYLLQAQASKAEIIGLASSAAHTQNIMKQAQEFRVTAKKIPFLLYASDIHAVGLEVLQGARFIDPWYWDQDEKSRAFSKKFFDRNGVMPTSIQADSYRALTHYLRSVQAAGTTDRTKVAAKMKELPIKDRLGDGGTVRLDGRVIRPVNYYEVKTPAESKYPWDYYKFVASLSGEEVFGKMDTNCSLKE